MFLLKPHDVNMPIKTVKKRSKNDEAPATSSRKSLTPIVQLRPPPQKVFNLNDFFKIRLINKNCKKKLVIIFNFHSDIKRKTYSSRNPARQINDKN